MDNKGNHPQMALIQVEQNRPLLAHAGKWSANNVALIQVSEIF